ncbi:MAG: extradiol ring-cleavage dioxygenase [Candidatus Lambdaproteobacteria bacterium]|nr:extradiol ring-cleavage dioxygenase [Candidatus Lambdaproteobacteria bacterium]
MAGGIICSAITPHTPRMGVEAGAPEFLRGVIEGSKRFGKHLQALKPELIVLHSAHWVCTFNWYVACHALHKGMCVADEAPDLISGLPYERPGDPEFGNLLTDQVKSLGVPCNRNESPHYHWDYGAYVPLQYIDPAQRIPVVLLSTVLSASLEECVAVGGAVATTAEKLGRRVAFISSCALSHNLVRGPGVWPSEARQRMDREFIALLVSGNVTEAKVRLHDYTSAVVAEMGGRNVATMLGTLNDKGAQRFRGEQHGAYGPSSGSGNTSISVWPTA